MREAEIKQAGYRAEIEQAQAAASQAGPLAQAKASQQVTEEQTRLAALQAEKREKDLIAEVEKPADADAYRTIRLAEADRDAIKARAEALAGGNQSLIAANRIVEQLPALVEAAAKGLSGANIVLVNGTEGVTDLLTNLVTQGYSIYEAIKGGVPQISTRQLGVPVGNGPVPAQSSDQKTSEVSVSVTGG